jgi:hypothetical protein
VQQQQQQSAEPADCGQQLVTPLQPVLLPPDGQTWLTVLLLLLLRGPPLAAAAAAGAPTILPLRSALLLLVRQDPLLPLLALALPVAKSFRGLLLLPALLLLLLPLLLQSALLPAPADHWVSAAGFLHLSRLWRVTWSPCCGTAAPPAVNLG